MEQRPIILDIEDAKQELIQCVNNILQTHKLSCYLIEPVFAELYSQIKASAQSELAQARARIQAEQNAKAQVKEGAE